VFTFVAREPARYLAPEIAARDHGVDDHLARELLDVDVGAELVAEPLDEGSALMPLGDDLYLVVVDGVDRGARAHDGDGSGWQGDALVRREGRPAHRVEARAIGLADDHRELGDRRLADGGDHLGAGADDALLLDDGADHEAWYVGQVEERDVEGVAE